MSAEQWRGRVKGLPHQGDERHLLLAIVRTHQALVSRFSRETGARWSQLALVRALAVGPPAGSGVLEIARRLEINAAAVTRQLQELERDGLVSRQGDSRDRRRSLVKLTAKGRRWLVEFHRRTHELERTLCAEAGADDLDAAVRVLGLVRSALGRNF
jgi:DNA-binding MarR family transcriptional regulator